MTVVLYTCTSQIATVMIFRSIELIRIGNSFKINDQSAKYIFTLHIFCEIPTKLYGPRSILSLFLNNNCYPATEEEIYIPVGKSIRHVPLTKQNGCCILCVAL